MWLTGAFYLCAYCPDRAEQFPDRPQYAHLREYRLDRIREVEVSSEPVSLAELPTLDCSFLLDSELAGRLETLHDAEGRIVQQVDQLPDGTLRVRIQEISLLRARQRVLVFGSHLLAIENPPELKQEVGRMIRNMAERFS